jgi:hypothetical protein
VESIRAHLLQSNEERIAADTNRVKQAMDVHKFSPEVARARELDAQGRHDDAIDALASATQRHDVEATTQLAKRIIVGDRAPRLPGQGIRLLQDAIKLGGAEAAGRLAVLFAAGVAGPPDWQSALRLLVLAAERGWAPAAKQLEVIASMSTSTGPRSGDRRPPPSAGPPSALLEGVDLRKLLVPDAGSTLNDDPRICVFPEFANKAVCDWLIASAQGRLSRALVYDVTTQSHYADDSRSNSFAVFSIVDADLVHILVQTRMSVACGQPVTHMEAPTVLHYATGEEIRDHFDFVDPAQPDYAEDVRRSGHRVITFLVYLNADYSGGETEFPKLGVSHSGKHCEGLYFANTLADGQADVRTVHAGRPPQAGEKWVFSQFIRNRPQRIEE